VPPLLTLPRQVVGDRGSRRKRRFWSMSDNAWPVPIPGQRTNRQAVTASERESSTVMPLRRQLMGESMNGGVERLVYREDGRITGRGSDASGSPLGV
jgi:hypothetical protein